SNAYGQLDIPAGLSGVSAVSAGGGHSAALKPNGTVVAWGNNGNDGVTDVPSGLSGVCEIATGLSFTLALTKNLAPIANAGGNRTATAVHSGNPANDTASLTLDGTGSSDPDGDVLSYSWTVDGIAAGTNPTLPLTLRPGTYTVVLTVTDPSNASSQDTATVTVSPAANQQPV